MTENKNARASEEVGEGACAPLKRRRKTCKRVDSGGKPCGSGAVGKTDFCVTHGGGRQCIRVNEDGKPCGSSARGQTNLCITHGGGRRCKHVGEDGNPLWERCRRQDILLHHTRGRAPLQARR
jgi:hypothetical protein